MTRPTNSRCTCNGRADRTRRSGAHPLLRASPPGNVGIALDLWLSLRTRAPATGEYDVLYDLDLVNPFRAAFITANGGTALGAMQALIGAMDAGGGRAYYNIHTAQFPGGEIRGNLAVPEPATLAVADRGAWAAVAGRRFARS
jgi:hypothetical protein